MRTGRRAVRSSLRAILWTAAFLAGGCVVAQRAERPLDDQFGHRYEPVAGDSRETLQITSPNTSREFFFFPAPLDSVHVRPAPFPATESPDAPEGVQVEVLVKGSLPDACIELHEIAQQRAGHLLEARLLIRRPRGGVCATVIRPYRFYFLLPGTYEPGHYTLKLNERVFAFQVFGPRAD